MKVGKYLKAILGTLLILITVQVVSAEIFSCDENKDSKHTFGPGENVYVKGYDLPDRTGTIYIVENVDWTEIPTGTAYSSVTTIVVTISNVDDDDLYATPPVEVGTVSNGDYPCTNCIGYPGGYDIIWDDGDGIWEGQNTDPVDYVECNGFETIPEFTTIAIPMAIALLAGLFFFRRQ
jgi:hypothetical protein